MIHLLLISIYIVPSLILGHDVLANDVPGVTFMEFWTCEFSKVVVVTLDHEERCQAKDAAGVGVLTYVVVGGLLA